MALRFYKAYTPGTRNRSVADCTELTKTRPEKSLTRALHRSKGRNNRGVITCRHRGGGHKRLYRQIDFRRNKYDMSASVKTIEYDPNRNARIALVEYEDGENVIFFTQQDYKLVILLLQVKRQQTQLEILYHLWQCH